MDIVSSPSPWKGTGGAIVNGVVRSVSTAAGPERSFECLCVSKSKGRPGGLRSLGRRDGRKRDCSRADEVCVGRHLQPMLRAKRSFSSRREIGRPGLRLGHDAGLLVGPPAQPLTADPARSDPRAAAARSPFRVHVRRLQLRFVGAYDIEVSLCPRDCNIEDARRRGRPVSCAMLSGAFCAYPAWGAIRVAAHPPSGVSVGGGPPVLADGLGAVRRQGRRAGALPTIGPGMVTLTSSAAPDAAPTVTPLL